MLKNRLLATIYHELGRQATNFSLQHSRREGEDVMWTKRRTFLELDPERDDWFIQACNHRQILQNEIIVDFDRPIPAETALEDPEVARVIAELQEDAWPFVVYHNGSKGVHIHIYVESLATISRNEREAFRRDFLAHFALTKVDPQLASDAVMISLELTPHWKSGCEKRILLNCGVDAWA